jgi:hypothetical protein
MVRLLDDFAKNAQEMDKFSRKLAILILTQGVDKYKLSKPEKLNKKFTFLQK